CTVGADDYVIRAQTALGGWAPRLDIPHQHASIRIVGKTRASEAAMYAIVWTGFRRARFGQDCRDAKRLAVSYRPYLHFVADTQQPYGVAQLGIRLDRVTIHRRDDVAGANACLL